MKLKLLLLSIFMLSIVRLSDAQIANHVVISEVYGGGGNSGAYWLSDFVELYNPTLFDVNLNGWSVQYASSSGSFNNATPLSGTIKAGGYYLVKQADGTNASGTAVALPTPDATGNAGMSGTAGKVLLCQCTAALAVSNPTTDVVDLVGFGSSGNFYEGSGRAPAPSNESSIIRASGNSSWTPGIGNGWDSNNNNTDFTSTGTVKPFPQNTSSPVEFSNTPSISVSSGTVSFGNVFINTSAPYKAILLKFANLDATDVAVVADAPFTISKDQASSYSGSATITDAERTASGLWLYITTSVATTGAASGSITLTHASLNSTVTVNLSANGVEALGSATKINTIQGAGYQATAGTFQVEAIVTGVYGTLEPAGFYIQEEDVDADADENTSEGIFVVMSDPSVKVGDLVRVLGTVQENGGSPSFNQAVIASPAVSILSGSNPAPSFTDISITDNTPASAEKYEGMRVQFASELTVTDVSDVAFRGEVVLSLNGSVYTSTQIVDPNDDPAAGNTTDGNSNVPAVNAYAAANAAKLIVLDDGSGLSNLTTVPYLDPVLNTIRVNSTISSLKGIMGYGFAKYRIQPLAGADLPVFTVTRPSVPTFANAGIKIASFNVLNYFNGNGQGAGFPTTRGAASAAAFAVQRSKIIKALAQMNADVVGLIEIENDGVGEFSAVQDLVNGLNAELGTPGAYAIVNDGASVQTDNSDQIKCAIIYKVTSLKTYGDAQLTGGGQNTRPLLGQTFETLEAVVPGGRVMAPEKFTFIVNHFKSKGASDATGLDIDQNDGQSAYNATRKTQAVALLAFIENLKISGGTDRIVSVGDYNAYYEEDPMDILRAGNLVVPSLATEYSYSFDGALGSLDHAVFSSTMSPYATVKKWNINSNEPAILQYTSTLADATSPFRSSDHDPILIGIDFSTPLPVRLVSFNARTIHDQVQVEWKTAEESNNSHFTVQRSADAISYEDIAVRDGKGNSNSLHSYSFTDTSPLYGVSYYRLKQTDYDGKFTYSRVAPVQMSGETEFEFSVYPNPVADHINLKFSGIASTHSNWLYQIMNKDGKALFSGKGSLDKINKSATNALPGLKSGVYIIRVASGTENHTFKFVKH